VKQLNSRLPAGMAPTVLGSYQHNNPHFIPLPIIASAPTGTPIPCNCLLQRKTLRRCNLNFLPQKGVLSNIPPLMQG
jgi:hypothetical protein